MRQILFALLILVGISACGDNIKTIHSFDEVNFNDITPDDLVIFDVDDTLIQPVDAYLINEHTPPGKALQQTLLQQYPQVKDWANLVSIMLKEAQRPLIEPSIVEKIQDLQRRNVSVIACTGMNVGEKGIYKSLEEWRYNHLKSLGFEGSFNQQEFRVSGFKKNPGFYKGLLSTDLEWKGPVIGAFLDKMKLHPKRIIMFDDTLDELKTVQKECAKRGIVFQGYNYKGAKSKPLNEDIARIQADYLISHHHWLTDAQALEMQQRNMK
jgi:hypothetical protein